jgi:hypothetical protein
MVEIRTRCASGGTAQPDAPLNMLGTGADALAWASVPERPLSRGVQIEVMKARRVVVAAFAVLLAGGLTACGASSRKSGLTTSGSSRSVHFGAFVLTVPKGFHQVETRQSRTSHALHSITVADDSRTAKAVSYGQLSPANGVVLYAENFGSAPPGSAPRLPLELHKLQRVPDAPLGDGTGTQWSAFLSGGGGAYELTVFEGSKASAADRAAIERALRSIRRAS